MMRTVLMLLTAAALTALGGCPVNCTTEAVGSVTVNVLDAEGHQLPEADVRYLPEGEDWTDHEACESVGDDHRFVCGWEVGGNIEIEVSLDGYETHTETVFVDEDECHVIPESLDVELQPSTI